MAKDDLYQELYTSFRWQVPEYFNIGWECCGRWAEDRARFALYYEDDAGAVEKYTYWDLQQQANRLSNALTALGVRRGDRVALVLPQCPQTIAAHIACYQMGAVAMPMSILFGPDALQYRLYNSAAAAILIDHAALGNLTPVRDNCPLLKHVIVVGESRDPAGRISNTLDYDELLAGHGRDFTPAKTRAEDPALLIYTSGTTGPPKGALKPHRVLIGNLSGFVASQNWFPKPADVFWSPADWAWTGGLMDALLPTLYFGQPIVANMAKTRERFDPLKAFALMDRYAVTNVFLFPTALKMMMKAVDKPREKYDLRLRAIMSAGESAGETVFHWAREKLGVTINEMCGQTEMNYVVGNSCEKWPAKPGSIGRPYPGHLVAVIDAQGNEVKPGTPGEMAVRRFDIHGDPDPVFFLGYWQNDEATRNKYTGDWCRTGDEAVMDEEGYFWYQGRADDMFKAAGYRIGPSEVENCLVKHMAVANCAVVPKPDADRGNVVKAYVVLIEGVAASDDLVQSLQNFVRGKLAPYEYPKEIEFVDALPMTTTGKVQRRVLRLAEEERHRKKLAATAP
ncbi:MAG: AMP-binding protein [Betaproteobacteria bacterium]|nr:AMP-binding protein [Betaproteobacteria bacterium]